jgi:hypothetical protein
MDSYNIVETLVRLGVSKTSALENEFLLELAEDINKSVDDLSNCVNSMSYDQEAQKIFSLCFESQHNTLQQKMFGCFLKVIQDLAVGNMRVDGRNEHAQKIAKDLYEVMKENSYFTQLPTV